MKLEDFKIALEKHRKWLNREKDGEQADFTREKLSDLPLRGVDLREAILYETDFSNADLCGANLSEATLIKANFSYANCQKVDFSRSDCTNANFSNANCREADFSYADLIDANCSYANFVDINGQNADLYGVNLNDAQLANANLRGINLQNANLRDTKCLDTSFVHANLQNADLQGANLCYTNLREADLRGTNLYGADLRNANLHQAYISSETNLTHVYTDIYTLFFSLQCPEEGSFIGYKKANNLIVKLLITENAKRSSATSRKCRCSEAEVLSITNLDGTPAPQKCVASDYCDDFVYTVGETVHVPDFDENRWNECSTGIHFFITRKEAELY